MNDSVILECCVQGVISLRDGVKLLCLFSCLLWINTIASSNPGTAKSSNQNQIGVRMKYVITCADVRNLLRLDGILKCLKWFPLEKVYIAYIPFVYDLWLFLLNLRSAVGRLCREFYLFIPKHKNCNPLLTLLLFSTTFFFGTQNKIFVRINRNFSFNERL